MSTTLTPSPIDSPVAAVAARPASHRSRRRRRAGGSGGLAAVIIAAPGVLVFLVFAWIPIGRAVMMALQETNFVADPAWVGWSNFSYVLADPLLWTALRNTAWFTVLTLALGIPLPLFLAVYMAELRRRRGWFTVLAYIPTVIPPVAAILLWRTFLDPSATGTFNEIAGWFGAGPFLWLNSPEWAMPIIALYATWAGAGSTVIIYLAGIAGVRAELYEAAELDGASIWQRVWHVTLPQMRGIILVIVLLQLIGAMQLFTEPFVFTGGGPNNATVTVLMLIYRYAFEQSDYGSATALSVLLALLLAVVSAVYALVTRKAASS